MESALVCLLLVGVASASPIVVREERSVYDLVPGAAGHGLLAPSVVAPGLLAALGHGLVGNFLAPGFALPTIPSVPTVPSVPDVTEPDYDDGSDDGSYYQPPDTLAPILAAVAPATFPPLDAPAATPAPPVAAAPGALAGPTLDGPVVPPLIIEGPSGTIKTGPLSTGAVSLANHPDHAVHTAH